jgi:peptidoglycan/LPS O-acetylase OafA/YrhL
MNDGEASFQAGSKLLSTRSPVVSVERSIDVDLVWMDVLKGMAIIGVVFDHWVPFWNPTSPSRLYELLRAVPWGAPVHLFFLLSGFGLTRAYLKKQAAWSWGAWTWRRLTKIIVPYWLAVLFSIALGVLGSALYASVDMRFSWRSLIALLTLTRAICPTSWPWNLAFWYMPVIVGLYFSFPVMIRVLQKRGPWFLFGTSALITYGSIVASAVLSGRYRGHPESWFPFFIVEFAFGMILAYAATKDPQQLNRLLGLRGLVAGACLCLVSLGIFEYVPHGDSYDDFLSMTGLFLIFLNLFWAVRSKLPVALRAMSAIGRKSYYIFLIHYPIMAFLIGPPVKGTMPPAMIPIFGLGFVLAMYYLCVLISKPIDRLTSLMYRRLIAP